MKRMLLAAVAAVGLFPAAIVGAQTIALPTDTPTQPETPASSDTEPVVVGGVTYQVHPACHVESIVLAKTQTYTGGTADLLTFIHINGLGWTTVFQPDEPLTGDLATKNVSDHLCGRDLPAQS